MPPYIAFPRFLLDSDLPETAKLLYMLLLDRARLSAKNDGWTDGRGCIFVYFTIADMAAALHKSEGAIKNCLASLDQVGLIVRKRQGAGLPNQIYVMLPAGADVQTDRKLSVRQAENCPMDGQKTGRGADRKLPGRNKENSKNNETNRGSKEDPHVYGSYRNVFLSKAELDDLRSAVPEWEQYIEKLSSYMASTGKSYQNHAATIKSWALRDGPATHMRSYECREGESL